MELDILRQYVVLYGWVKGCDLTELAGQSQLEPEAREKLFAHRMSLVNHELGLKGYHVVDMKPQHIIVRQRTDGSLLRDRNGQMAYALVDYELSLTMPAALTARTT